MRTAAEVMAAFLRRGVTDEFVVPTALTRAAAVREGDAVVFFKLPPGPRPRNHARALVDPAFAAFERGACPQVSFVCLTEYDPEIPAPVAYRQGVPRRGARPTCWPRRALRQYHIAETEK